MALLKFHLAWHKSRTSNPRAFCTGPVPIQVCTAEHGVSREIDFLSHVIALVSSRIYASRSARSSSSARRTDSRERIPFWRITHAFAPNDTYECKRAWRVPPRSLCGSLRPTPRRAIGQPRNETSLENERTTGHAGRAIVSDAPLRAQRETRYIVVPGGSRTTSQWPIKSTCCLSTKMLFF